MQKHGKMDICVVDGLEGSLRFTILIGVINNQN